jgi:hypothetical protein
VMGVTARAGEQDIVCMSMVALQQPSSLEIPRAPSIKERQAA